MGFSFHNHPFLKLRLQCCYLCHPGTNQVLARDQASANAVLPPSQTSVLPISNPEDAGLLVPTQLESYFMSSLFLFRDESYPGCHARQSTHEIHTSRRQEYVVTSSVIVPFTDSFGRERSHVSRSVKADTNDWCISLGSVGANKPFIPSRTSKNTGILTVFTHSDSRQFENN